MNAPHVSRAPLFNIPQRGEQPTAFFRALSEADSYCQELDTVRELQCRISELEATPSLAERMRAAAETIRELNSLCGVGLNASVSPIYLDAEAARMELP